MMNQSSDRQQPMIIVITGGGISSLGKGIVASSLGALMRSRGFLVRIKKFDPYINVDCGTMSPYQHGEVFVTQDGAEVDLDFGSYERFVDVEARKTDSTTTGKIYQDIIAKERKGDFLGETIQMVPHITDEIGRRMQENSLQSHLIICEIGGTVGDIEIQPYLEAVRQLKQSLGACHLLNLHLGWVPYVASAGEVKTKLMQNSVKELQRCGIQPDILVCRSQKMLDQSVREKISLFCNVPWENVINAPDMANIYHAPLIYHHAGLDEAVCRYILDHRPKEDDRAKENLSFQRYALAEKKANLAIWETIDQQGKDLKKEVVVGILGKYVEFQDAYRSLVEALYHAGLSQKVSVRLQWIDAESLEEKEAQIQDILKGVDALIVPGGFGSRGIEGMIRGIRYVREKKIPFLGICLGMQLAVIESVRQLPGYAQATSSEFSQAPGEGTSGHSDIESPVPTVVALLKEWSNEEEWRTYQPLLLGGTMRLGSYPCYLTPESLVAQCYGALSIQERHRHRYEVNARYQEIFQRAGIVVSGRNGALIECIERKDHPWFVAVQFHPEFCSRPFRPHPLFESLIQSALQYAASREHEKNVIEG